MWWGIGMLVAGLLALAPVVSGSPEAALITLAICLPLFAADQFAQMRRERRRSDES